MLTTVISQIIVKIMILIEWIDSRPRNRTTMQPRHMIHQIRSNECKNSSTKNYVCTFSSDEKKSENQPSFSAVLGSGQKNVHQSASHNRTGPNVIQLKNPNSKELELSFFGLRTFCILTFTSNYLHFNFGRVRSTPACLGGKSVCRGRYRDPKQSNDELPRSQQCSCYVKNERLTTNPAAPRRGRISREV